MKSIIIAVVTTPILFLLIAINLFPECTTDVAVNAKRMVAGLNQKEITLEDGSRYVYLESEQHATDLKPTMVLLHGFGADKDNFTEVAPYLVDNFHLIVPDHQGFGDSTKDMSADYSPLAQALRLNQLFKLLGVNDFHLGGSSMGGHISMTYAALYPEQVKSLWLLNPGGVSEAPDSEMRIIMNKTGEHPLLATTPEEFHKVFDFVMSKPPFVPDFILDVKSKNRIDNYDLEKVIFGAISSDNVTARVTGLETPTLIVWGAEDRVLHPGAAEILHKAMPNSEVIIMPNIGHLPMLEDPRASAEGITAFIKDRGL